MEVALDEIVRNLYEESWSPKFIEGQRWVECACQKTLDRNIEDTFCCNRTKNRRIINSKTFDSKNVIIRYQKVARLSQILMYLVLHDYHSPSPSRIWTYTICCNTNIHTDIRLTTILEVIFTLFLPSTLLVILQPSDSNLNQGIVAQLY